MLMIMPRQLMRNFMRDVIVQRPVSLNDVSAGRGQSVSRYIGDPQENGACRGVLRRTACSMVC